MQKGTRIVTSRWKADACYNLVPAPYLVQNEPNHLCHKSQETKKLYVCISTAAFNSAASKNRSSLKDAANINKFRWTN